jgi:hypothetical protein
MHEEMIRTIVRAIEHNEEVFEVQRELTVGKFRVLRVLFPQCPNGDKIMVYREQQAPVKPYERIRPHFNQEGSPFARFEPTEEGWDAAVRFARTMME